MGAADSRLDNNIVVLPDGTIIDLDLDLDLDTIFALNYTENDQRPTRLPNLEKTRLIKNPANIKSETVMVVQEDSDTPLVLQFTFDCTCAVIASVVVVKKPSSSDDETGSKETQNDAPVIVFPHRKYPAKLGHKYSAPLTDVETLKSLCKDEGLHLLLTLMVEDRKGHKVRGQNTYVTLSLNKGDSAPVYQTNDVASPRLQQQSLIYVSAIRQSLDIRGHKGGKTEKRVSKTKSFRIREIFGLQTDNKAADTEAQNADGRECIICLCEPRTTVVLPCRHMAFCDDCASAIRLRCDTCPICRRPVATLLQFSALKTDVKK